MQRQWAGWLPFLVLWSVGCEGQSSAPEPRSPAPQPAAHGAITREQLGNLRYPSEVAPNGHVQLHDGMFQTKESGDATARLIVKLTPHMAEGDLNGDGQPDAAVVLESDSGGSGSFMDLAAVLATPAGPKPVAVIDLGDRTEIKGMTVNDGRVEIELIGHGPGDPVCCPTQVQRREYRLEGERWVANERRAPP